MASRVEGGPAPTKVFEARGAPQSPQNASSGSLTKPHAAHERVSSEPHVLQNFLSGRFSVWQCEQIIAVLPESPK
jgi:hypothetical protein